MSFYFTITTNKRISYNDLLIELINKNVEIDQPEILQDLVADGGCKFFIPYRSTRGVTLRYENQEYSIGLNVVASEADFELALNITETLSKYTGALILPEDRDEPIDIEILTKDYSQKWIDEIKLLGIDIFIEKIGMTGNDLSIGCCYMMYSIGPKIHSQLDSSSKESYYHGLVKLICQTQFFDREKYAIPSYLVVTNKKTDKKEKMIVLYPNGDQFLPVADVLVIRKEDDWVELPFGRINEIATNKFTLIDEQQYLVDALSEAEYHSLFLAARNILTDASVKNENEEIAETPKTKRWWQFW
ncbi:hypothetical protein [Pinibacter aurantiacus]|uniref:DUF4299 family protein n=1 Tax=Pinibacter aurantiacus TaxID=2851599 RepID=A0A9E2SAW3_9BACT|nr:hypothetical protein [Pinibacter aurantiacus]MBV4357922.1 hypothetical protein [Pinibacter aurantiacus]